jgi:hypothetical protein
LSFILKEGSFSPLRIEERSVFRPRIGKRTGNVE